MPESNERYVPCTGATFVWQRERGGRLDGGNAVVALPDLVLPRCGQRPRFYSLLEFLDSCTVRFREPVEIEVVLERALGSKEVRIGEEREIDLRVRCCVFGFLFIHGHGVLYRWVIRGDAWARVDEGGAREKSRQAPPRVVREHAPGVFVDDVL